MGSALLSPVAPIATRILASNEGERGLLIIVKCPNSQRTKVGCTEGVFANIAF